LVLKGFQWLVGNSENAIAFQSETKTRPPAQAKGLFLSTDKTACDLIHTFHYQTCVRTTQMLYTGTTRYLKISSFNCLSSGLDTCIVTNNQSYIQSSVVHKQYEADSGVKTPAYSQLHHYHLIFTTDMPNIGKVYECCIRFWGDSLVSEFYVPTFRNTLPVPSL